MMVLNGEPVEASGVLSLMLQQYLHGNQNLKYSRKKKYESVFVQFTDSLPKNP